MNKPLVFPVWKWGSNHDREKVFGCFESKSLDQVFPVTNPGGVKIGVSALTDCMHSSVRSLPSHIWLLGAQFNPPFELSDISACQVEYTTFRNERGERVSADVASSSRETFTPEQIPESEVRDASAYLTSPTAFPAKLAGPQNSFCLWFCLSASAADASL